LKIQQTTLFRPNKVSFEVFRTCGRYNNRFEVICHKSYEENRIEKYKEKKEMEKIAITVLITLLAFSMPSMYRIEVLAQEPNYPVHNLNTGLNYTTIQAAINAPETLDNHTIFVESGIYYEHVVITKDISLVGENKDTTIIDGNATDYALFIKASAQVSNFWIRNAKNGIGIEGSYSEVHDNIISSNLRWGIEIFGVYEAVVSNNLIVSNGWDGIFAYEAFAAGAHVIQDNVIVSNSLSGISLQAGYCQVIGNNISSNAMYGIELQYDAYQTTVHSNWIIENGWGGVSLYSDDNLFYNNYFKNGRGNVFTGIEPGSGNFNIEKTPVASGNIIGGPFLGGNYWHDYTGKDDNYDGIGDTPYMVIYYSSYYKKYDNLPLVKDMNPPNFANWHQNPSGEEIQPDVPVIVTIDVMDNQSRVNTVTLLYKNNSTGTWTQWIEIPMVYVTGNTYKATIPALPEGTHVEYYISAIDNENNSAITPGEGYHYQYIIIPEITTLMLAIAFFVASFFIVARNKKH
jgi:parallel beta-helix repeat protein